MADLKRITGAVRVTIDEFEFATEPNSFGYKDGYPSRAVKGTAGETYYSENYEDAIGMLKFSLHNSKANDDAIRQVRSRTKVTVKAVEVNGEFSKVMKAGVILNDDESTTGSDGMIEITLNGTPLE